MKVITGSARGRRLQTLAGEQTRPTGERVKEGLFSAIQFEIEGRRVLDLFAGSGQLGVEALSRGAAHCTFVDSDKAAIAVIRANVAAAGFTENATVMQTDASAFLNAGGAEPFGLIFLDPPYGSGLLQKALLKIPARLAKGGIAVCEAPFKESVPSPIGDMALYRSYRYSKTEIHVFRMG